MRILYATDGSEGALAGARVLRRLTLSSDSEILVLTVLGSESEGERALQEARDALAGTPGQLTYEAIQGSPAEVVLRRAEELEAGLIVVGSRGLNAVARFLLGSVAERVVNHARCPVLVARPLRGDLGRVVLGLDGSRASRRAAEYVRDFPLPTETEVVLATAIPLYQVGGTPAGRVPSLASHLQRLQLEERREAEDRLEEVSEVFRSAGRPVSTEFRQQHPAEGLLEIAERRGADLLVVGRQGLSAIERFTMGSVSTAVLRHASCSVLVVPE